MTNLEAVKALQKADVLKMRGRGSGGYYYDDNTIYDAGCFDWEIVCTPEGGYTQEYDFSHYENMSNDEYYDQDTHTHPMDDNPSDLIQRGIEVVNRFLNGDNPIVVSDKVIEVANLTSMGITTHGFALNAIQDAAKGAAELSALGKLATGVSAGGALLGAVVSIYDATDGNTTPQDIGMLVAAGLGAAATVVGMITTAPLWVAGLTAGAIVVTFVSLCLPDNEGQSTSNY